MAHTDAPAVSDVAGSAEPPATISISEAILAPWRYMFRPALAAQIMYRSSGAGLMLSALPPAIVVIAVSLVAAVVSRMRSLRSGAAPQFAIEYQTFAESWREALDDPSALWLTSWAISLLFLVVWLCSAMANVYRLPIGTPPRRTSLIAAQAIAATFASGTAMFAAALFAGVFAAHEQLRDFVVWSAGEHSDRRVWFITLLCLIPWVALLVWAVAVFLAVRGLRPLIPLPVSRLGCEGCAYDLTHQSESGRCTECGLTLADSMNRLVARPDTDWERKASLRTWIATTEAVLCRPQAFFRRLSMSRDDAASYAFALSHVLAIGVATFLIHWVHSSFAVRGATMPSPANRISDGVLASTVTAFVAALLLRGGGKIACRMAAFGGARSAGGILARIVDYQAVLLWPMALGVLWYFLATVPWSPLSLLPEVLSQLFSSARAEQLFAMVLRLGPLAAVLIFAVNRYRIAFRQTRFANF